VLFSTLIRWGGLVAMVAAALSVVADLAALSFVFAQGSNAGFVFRDMIAEYSRALLLLGLVALYAYQFKAVGIPGLVGFLEASVGMALESLRLVWPAVLASLGWVLFGAASLYAEVYSSAAIFLLIIGAGLSGVVNALLVSGLLKGNASFAASAMVIDIIFNMAIAWLGLGLFTRRS
jgi:hypothetical protein